MRLTRAQDRNADGSLAGLALVGKHFLAGGNPISGSLFDSELFFFYSAKRLIEKGRREGEGEGTVLEPSLYGDSGGLDGNVLLLLFRGGQVIARVNAGAGSTHLAKMLALQSGAAGFIF